MNKSIYYALCALTAMGLMACNANQNSKQKEIETEAKVTQVMTKEAQQQLSPDMALDDLLKGNKRYMSGKMVKRDLNRQVAATTNGQFPKAVVLACIDSRVPVEYIFDQGVGDIFVVRVAGNIEDEELLGSMEYGIGVAGAKLLMVLGHENCGAVKSAIKQVDVGSEHVSCLLHHIEPAIQKVEGERNHKDKDYLDRVIKSNVVQTLADIRSKSKIISSLEEKGDVKVVGAYYDLKNGEVSILDK
jgi:carbonic anhydrase